MEREVYNRTESENIKELQNKLNNVKAALDQAKNECKNLKIEKETREKARKEQIEERDARIKALEDKLGDIRGEKSQADNKVFYGFGDEFLGSFVSLYAF